MKTKKKPARKTRKPVPEQFNPAKPLKLPMQEAFCQNLAHGSGIEASPGGGFTTKEMSASEAYRKAGYIARGKAADVNASRLLTNANFRARLDYLRTEQAKMLAERGCASREELCSILTSAVRHAHAKFISEGKHGIALNSFVKSLADITGLNKADQNGADYNTMVKEFIEKLTPPEPESERTPITG